MCDFINSYGVNVFGVEEQTEKEVEVCSDINIIIIVFPMLRYASNKSFHD